MKKYFKQVLTLLISGLLLAGCNATNTNTTTPSTQPQEKQELKMAMTNDPDGLDPQRTTSASTFQITHNFYDTLVSIDTQGNLKEGLATSWEFSEDGLSISFHLRPNVQFSNKNQCDSQAVISSFERLKQAESPRAQDYANIIDMKADDDLTVTFTTQNLDVALASSFAYPWAAIVDVSVADSLKTKPVGTGPFVLEQWVAQQELSMIRNDAYYAPAKLKKITFKMMPDSATQVAALRNHELDMITISGDQVASFEKDANFNILSTPMNSLQLMAMNLENEALAKLEVRQAIQYAVDKQALIDTVWWGYGQKIGSHYPTGLKEYVDTNDQYAYNPQKAKDLLKQAGYENGLTLKMVLPKNYTAYVNAGQVIADQLKAVGIQCEIEIVEWASWLSDVYNGRKYDLTVVGHTGRLDPYVLLARYQSESKENYFNYSNNQVDELLKDAKQNQDETIRTEDYQQIQKILAQEVPAYYIQTPTSLWVTQADVSGFETYPLDILAMKDVYFTK